MTQRMRNVCAALCVAVAGAAAARAGYTLAEHPGDRLDLAITIVVAVLAAAGGVVTALAARRPFVPSPSHGCVGCGARLGDVHTPPEPGWPRGEGYCWTCVDELGVTGYVVLPGRERTATAPEVPDAR